MDDFRSDTVTRPTPGMRRAMAEAEVGDDVYGEDPTVNRLQETVAALLKKEAALFVPSATMANQLAILTLTERGDEVLCDADAHVYYYEAGAPATLSGVMCRPLVHREGVVPADELDGAVRPANVHFPRPRLFVVENTHNRAGGAAHRVADWAPTIAAARRHGLLVHLDGARIFNAAAAVAETPAELAGFADTVTICLSKGLGAPVGALLAGPQAVIDRARRYRKQLGGGMRQAGILAAAGLYALEHHRERLAVDHARAARIADALRLLPGLTVRQPTHPTNMVLVDVGEPADRVVQAAYAAGIRLGAVGPTTLRIVTHLDVDDTAVARLIDFFRRFKEVR
jgi:threonine aldolase